MAQITFYTTRPWQEEYIRQALPDADLSFHKEGLSKENPPEETDSQIVSVFVDSAVSKEVLDKLPNLKLIAARSTGFDHIDLAECKKRGIAVASVPSYGENTVAEHTFALLLTLSRRIYDAYEQVREEGDFSYYDLQGFDLKGKTLGVVGTGRIGRHSIQIAKGFGMEVVAFDVHPDRQLAKGLGFEYLPLEDVLARSDVVTLHVPYMKATHHLINAARIAQMKPGAYLINTSRGAVVDTQALVIALKEKRLGGAGIDVLEEEGVIKDELNFLVSGKVEGHNLKTIVANHVLVDMPNVIVTPHNAFNTKEALERILNTTVENIRAFLGGKPQNVVE